MEVNSGQGQILLRGYFGIGLTLQVVAACAKLCGSRGNPGRLRSSRGCHRINEGWIRGSAVLKSTNRRAPAVIYDDKVPLCLTCSDVRDLQKAEEELKKSQGNAIRSREK